MRFAVWILIAVAWCGIDGQTSSAQSSDAQIGPPGRIPVLLELFTSEGCSDCPPAERLLAQVDAAQPFAGVEAIVLEEHVTYWDHQGWRDPYSLEEMTERQTEYKYRFGLNDIYTPQMVVDGAEQFVGSSGPGLAKAVASAATKPKEALAIANPQFTAGAVTFAVHGRATKDAQIVAVIAADATVSRVSNGENAGKTLHHVAVVRAMKKFGGEAADGRPLKLDAKGLTGPVRIVVFLVERKTGHVLGVAEEKLDAAQQAKG